MHKIGILTHYYGNQNYGGVLQSYALVTFINRNYQFSAEQICFELNVFKYGFAEKKKSNKYLSFFNPKKYFNKVKSIIINVLFKSLFLKRRKAVNKFADLIRHSKNIFNLNNIQDCIFEYDFFITGSDQVWNLDWFTPVFFLEFVSNNKKKISYAASVGHSNINEDRLNYFKNVLPTFDAISVREKDSVDLLQPLTNKKVEWVLDPTLLLDRKDWDEICPGRRINGKYLFCYFLGRDKIIRKLARQYAKKNKLKIVNLPHLTGFCKADVGFGHYKLYDVAPNDFISLIKYSECVFTDSFHACVFSSIYNKNFYIFNRKDLKNASGRLYSLCELFECQEHFCDTDDKFSLNYIESLSPINYNKVFKLFHEMKEKSKRFLQEALNNE